MLAACEILLTSTAVAQNNPFDNAGKAAPSGAPQSASTASTTGTASTTSTQPADSECDHITAATCAKQNSPMFLAAAGYVVVATLLACLWRSWWAKRGTASGGATFFVPMLAAGAAAGTLAGLDPIRNHDLTCCLASNVFRGEIFLQDSAVGRAFLLGVLPTMVLYTLVSALTNLLKR